MYDGFIKVAAATPELRVADVEFNAEKSLECIKSAAEHGAKLIVLPELGLTSYSCGDLFFQVNLINRAKDALIKLATQTAKLDILSVIGLPVLHLGKLYNCSAFIKSGEILGFATKSNLPNYGEFCEPRYFNTMAENTTVSIEGKDVPIGPNLIFTARDMETFSVAADICEDLWTAAPPSNRHCANGATIIVNQSAGNELVGKSAWRKKLVEVQSARCASVYVYANAGMGESTTDMVFAGHNMIYEAGIPLAESKPFSEGIIYADADVQKVIHERCRISSYPSRSDSRYEKIFFDTKIKETKLERNFSQSPFIPSNADDIKSHCEEIFTIQYHALKKRLSHIGAKTVTIGISGGLDSTLALLVTAKAFESLGLSKEGIIAVTMPCFGTSDRTYNNAKALVSMIGATLREINIKESVTLHLKDIGADINCHDVTFENAQARERTQILMDIANKTGGIVVGTGDLSELALGFATYNGDHMSMYGVNASVPKTMMRHIVKYVADSGTDEFKALLYDVVDTPVSPELLPPEEDGSIAQQTEEIVGPYELHDFFLYYMVRWGFSREKILRIASLAYAGVYDAETIAKWLDIFIKKFYNSQFKRSCMPDGVKVGSVALSPRGAWRMPSDAVIPR